MRASSQHRPSDPRQLIGQRAGHHVGVTTGGERLDPYTQRVGARVGVLHDRSRALHEQAAEVAIAAFTDTEQGGLAAGAVLARH